MSNYDELTFVEVGGAFDLGWSFTEVLPTETRAAIEAFMPWPQLLERFSAPRRVELASFSIATSTVDAETLLGDIDEDDDDHLLSIEDLCSALDERLEPLGLRLPSEDELEAACGGSIFPWGDEVPAGIPWADETPFKGHLAANERGLQLNSNPYRVEISRHAFKLGDGGEALCGAYPWPIPWLSFCPSFRLVGEQTEDLLTEFLEEARVRPVRR